MRIGFLGDIVGKAGRESVQNHIAEAKNNLNLDLIIANAENAAHGFGITKKIANGLLELPIDVLTGGNHSFDNKDMFELLKHPRILTPLNIGEDKPQEIIVELNEKIAIINILGSFSMGNVDNPFKTTRSKVDELRSRGINHIFIDFHAEATSEKNALFAMLKGEVSCIVGTHTHVGTDDLFVHKGTAYASDAGLNGIIDGVIGMDAINPIQTFLTGIKKRLEVAKDGNSVFQILVIELDPSGSAKSIQKYRSINNQALELINKGFILA